jgi:hypothetical protein
MKTLKAEQQSPFSDFLRHIELRIWGIIFFGPFFPSLSTHAGL